MTKFSPTTFAGTVLVAGLLSLGTAHAQSYGNPAQQGGDPAQRGAPPAQQQGGAPPTQGNMPGHSEPIEVDDKTLDKFADAYGEVQSIQQEFAQELQQVSEESEAQSLQRSAQEKMMEAVKDSGLSVTEYNEISVAVSSDPELQKRIRSSMDN